MCSNQGISEIDINAFFLIVSTLSINLLKKLWLVTESDGGGANEVYILGHILSWLGMKYEWV